MAPSVSFSLTTAMLWGIEARPVTVEVSLSAGLPGITIVGRPDSSVAESRSRIRCALKASGYDFPRNSITVNLAPADVRKTGSAFDLPIAVALLAATNQISGRGLEECLVVGELSLTGEVCPVRGLMAYAVLARQMGLRLISPEGVLVEVDAVAPGRFVSTLSDFRNPIPYVGRPAEARHPEAESWEDEPDYGDIVGQEVAKRAMCIAAAGGLGVLMVGPQGIGKTMLAKGFPRLLPPLSDEEYYECMLVRSVADVADRNPGSRMRPFRAPHHSASTAAVIGGGRTVKPGEISLAHNGVLFLDELAEFNNATLQALRQPIEEGRVRVSRAEGLYEFPCSFELVAASNPCPCGHYGDREVRCTCSETSIKKYQAKLAGPLIDRIDLVVALERPPATAVMRPSKGESSAELARKVAEAREFAQWRDKSRGDGVAGGEDCEGGPLVARALRRCEVSQEAVGVLEKWMSTGGSSVRGVMAIVRIARSIADLEGSGQVTPDHVYEAIGYRNMKVVR